LLQEEMMVVSALQIRNKGLERLKQQGHLSDKQCSRVLHKPKFFSKASFLSVACL
jgi:hypothetical protein